MYLREPTLPFDKFYMITPEEKAELQTLLKRTNHLWSFLKCDAKKISIVEMEEQMSSPTFWDNQNEAKRVSSECNRLKQIVEKIESFKNQVGDIEAMSELCDEDESDTALSAEFSKELKGLVAKIEELEVESFLSEPMDVRPALLSIHAGAGGTESCDWADMLMRMYVRWAERRGFDVDIQDLQPGEEAGISRCTLRIDGMNAYG